MLRESLLPRHMELAVICGAVGEIEIYKRLIRDAGLRGLAFEKVNGIRVKVYGYLLLELFGLGVRTGIQFFNLVFFTHFIYLLRTFFHRSSALSESLFWRK